MSQQIPTLDLTGATTNQSGTISWAQANIHSSQQQWVKGLRPYLELVNLSACTLAINLPRGLDNMPLPAGAWHVYPLSVEEFSYDYMVLNAQQNAAANKVYGWYYAAFEEAPKTGQVVNQSQALAAPALNATQRITAAPGGAPLTITLAASTTAAAFTIQSIALAFSANSGTIGVGKPITLQIDRSPSPTLWQVYEQERTGTAFYPLNLVVPNAIPGTTQVSVKAFPTDGSAVFTANTTLAVIASIS